MKDLWCEYGGTAAALLVILLIGGGIAYGGSRELDRQRQGEMERREACVAAGGTVLAPPDRGARYELTEADCVVTP